MPRITVIAVLAVAATAATAAAQDAAYRDVDALLRDARAIADGHADCALETLGRSGQGTDIPLLVLAPADADADAQPALLLVAGLDARHRVGPETALRVARSLLDDPPASLAGMTVYVVPLANPDGAALRERGPDAGRAGTPTPVDEDHDGRVDEDPPVDLDGNGFITMMRRADPPLDDAPTRRADPAEPRLLTGPDPVEGLGAVYSVYVEGVDADGDGRIAEDGPGTVDLDHNFMHEYPEHGLDAGAYPLSEPEARALAEFVVDHPNIVMAVTYGRHDTLVHVPDGKGRDASGEGPKDLNGDDVAWAKAIGSLYEETTGQKRAAKESHDGSFHVWLSAHRGIPSFAATLWGRPDPAKKDDAKKKDDEDAGADAPAEGDEPAAEATPAEPAGTWSGTVEFGRGGATDLTLELTRDGGRVSGEWSTSRFSFPVEGTYDAGALELSGALRGDMTMDIRLAFEDGALVGEAAGPGGRAIPLHLERAGDGAESDGDGGGGAKRKKDKDKPADEEAAAWLRYSDEQRDGAGFVEWAPYDHPTLGAVEIGGFVPGFRMNPPASELDGIAEKQAAFVAALLERRPSLRFVGPTVDALADGVYEVRLGIVNDGRLPTMTAQARAARSMLPTIIRLDVPIESIVAGDRVLRAWGIDGGGTRETYRWIVRAAPGERLAVDVSDPRFGDHRLEFDAQETRP